MINFKPKTIITTFLIIACLVNQVPVFARTVDEIEKEIQAKHEELNTVNTGIKTKETEIEQQKKELEKATGNRAKLQAQVNIFRNEMQIVQDKLNELKNQKDLSELEKEKRILQQDEYVKNSYLNWKQNNPMTDLFKKDVVDMLKVSAYHAALTGEEQGNIETLGAQLQQIEKDLKESEKQKITYEDKLKELNAQASAIEQQIQSLDNKIKSNQNDVKNYRAKVGQIQSQIDELTAEQKEIQELEGRFLGKANNGGTKPIEKGEIYFKGVGREVSQGHGVGMSQFGALGAALKGWSAEKIIEYYYPGAKVVKYKSPPQINVQGYGNMDLEDYVSGAGEVPDYACEDLDIKFDNSSLWKCWPKEAIKAQAIAFRTYGLSKTMNGSSICADARCQVYKGGNNKEWAAEETEYEVAVYDGKPITAFYSSDNHNGWGTANNDTVWSNADGTGTPKPYLKAVNDKDFTYHYTYTDWTWRTNGYTLEEIDEMLDWNANSDKSSSSNKQFIKELHQSVGKVKSLDFVRDPSGRVSRVKIIGEKGSKYMAGWLFKSAWNIWIGNEKPSGELDYIYSLTYYKLSG